jgi:phosphinothricin acetyltransferase
MAGQSVKPGIEISDATMGDLPEIVAIQNASAATSIASFDPRPVTVDERLPWFERTSGHDPYKILVARQGAAMLGYASSGRYRDHEAFAETVEVGISLRAESRGRGVGTLLYQHLLEYLSHQQVHVVVAGIAIPNEASVALHRKFGFTDVGVFREYAIKNGLYLSSLWMQKIMN